MDSTIETDLILTRRQADGTVEWTPIEIPNRIDAAAGESYALIERAEFAAPQSLVAQRQGDALVIELGGTEALVVEGFFLAENVTFHPNPDIAGGAGPFSGPALAPDTTAIATSAEGATVLWSAGEFAGELVGQAAEPEDDEADGSEPGGGGGGSPALWGGLALGGLALAAAGGGGGGGGGSSGGGGGGGGGTTDTTAPQITSPATAASIDENSGAGQVVYRATATDSSAVTFSLASGDDAAAFDIDADSGEVTLIENPDFEGQASYAFTVIATDAAGNAARQDVSLSITNVDDATPTITSGDTAAPIDEETGAGQVVYTATADDDGDISDGVTFSLASSGDAADFDIDPATGEVTLTENPDFETQSSYTFTVVATDAAGNSDQQTVSLEIVDRDESAPIFTSGFTADPIDENSGADQVIYTATATDEQDIVFSLAESGDTDAFEIDPNTGEVTLTENPNFEAQPSYSFAVIATDAEDNSRQLTVSLDVNDLDEVAPNITSGATAPAIDENSGAGRVIYTATADDDGDISDGVTFSLASSGDSGAFDIDPDTGEVTLTENPDFESQSSYTFTVVATDGANNTDRQSVSLSITDVDDTAPTVDSVALTGATGRQNDTLNAGDVVTVTVTMSEDTNVSTAGGTPRIALNVGGSTEFATYASGSGSDTLLFEYTVQAGDTDGNGISIRSNGLELAGGTIRDTAGNAADLSHDPVSNDSSFVVDTTAPTLSSSTPADNATAVATGADIVLIFSEAVQAGSGNITISNGAGDTRVIDVEDARVSISGNEVTIDPGSALDDDSSYNVQIDSGALTDTAGNPYAGISNATTLNFTTQDTTAPTLSSSTPADNATAVATGADIVLIFSEAVQAGSGNITISNGAGDTRVIDVEDARVSISGNEVTVDPGSALDDDSSYNVQIDSGALTDTAGNPYAGISNATTLNFTTQDTTAPTLSSSTPADNATAVATGADIVLIFSEAVQAGSGNITISNGAGDTRVIDVEDARVSISGNEVTVDPGSALDDDSSYNVQIDSGALTDTAGNPYAGISNATTLNFTTQDTTAPTLSSSTPADNATAVATGADIVLIFSEAVQAGSGNITISNGAGDTRVIDVEDARVSISGNEVTIDPGSALDDDSSYNVQIDSGALTDTAGNPYAGISNATTLNFTTQDTTAPTLSSSTPADNATAVATGADIVLIFSEAVQAGSGNITISNGAGDTRVIDVEDARVSISGNEVTVDPGSALDDDSSYNVQIDSGALTDTAGNPYAGISNATTLNFTTQDTTAPTLSSSTPADNATAVATGADIVLIFSEAVQAGSGNITISNGAGDTRVIDVEDARVSISGNEVTVDPGSALDDDSSYNVQIDSGALTDTAGNPYAGISNATTLNFTTQDTTAPTLSSSTPADNATAVATGADIVLIFSEAVQAGSGNITISNGAGDTRVIDVEDARVSISGNEVTVDPGSALDDDSSYNVQIDSGALTDTAGNPYAGISNATTLNFTTQDTTAPTLSSSTPADNATAVATGADIVLIFSEAVQAGSGNITISNGAGDTRVIDVDSPQVSISGNEVTVDPGSALDDDSSYNVQIDSGALTDTAGNPYAGISNNTTLNFTTQDTTAPTLSSSTPADDAMAIDVDEDIVLTFSEDVLAGSGNITISDGAGDTRVIGVTDAQVSISGNQVTIDPAADLNPASTYNVQIDGGALTDAAGNPYAGISNATTLNFDTVDPSVVVFDLVSGVSSDHSGRSFDSGTSYTIYVRVDSDSAALSTDGDGPGAGDTWGAWSGAGNLGSDDRIVLVGTGADVQGPGGIVTSFDATAAAWNAATGPAASIGANGTFDRATGASANSTDLWSGNWGSNPNIEVTALNTQIYLTTMPGGVLTSQGLA